MEQPENVSDWSRITTSYFDWITETLERYLTGMTGVPYILDTKLYTLLTHGYFRQCTVIISLLTTTLTMQQCFLSGKLYKGNKHWLFFRKLNYCQNPYEWRLGTLYHSIINATFHRSLSMCKV